MIEENVPKSGDDLTRLMLGCLLFRLGGEQTFTPEEIDDIKEVVGGVQVLLTSANAIIVRVKTPEAYKDIEARQAPNV